MKTEIQKNAKITIEVPAALLDLEVPPGMTLENWVKAEKERISGLYPFIKGGEAEVGTDWREMREIATQQAKLWETWRELVNLKLLEAAGFNKKLTANGRVFAERRDHDVPDHEVHSYRVNAVFPASS